MSIFNTNLFFFNKTSRSRLCLSSLFLHPIMAIPAAEKTRSLGAEEAGIVNRDSAKEESSGCFASFDDQ